MNDYTYSGIYSDLTIGQPHGFYDNNTNSHRNGLGRIKKATSFNSSKNIRDRVDISARFLKHGMLSLGEASELAKLFYEQFIQELKRRDIRIQFGPENLIEAERDLENIRRYLVRRR